jgi:hypothetical protein
MYKDNIQIKVSAAIYKMYKHILNDCYFNVILFYKQKSLSVVKCMHNKYYK